MINDPEELQLTFIPPELRETARNFEEEMDAELAAGYLRSNGIPAEVGKMMIPGLQYELALWVRRDDLDDARALLEEADARARGPQPLE